MFGPVPKKYWSAKYKVDEKNMCIMSLRCLFIVVATWILDDNGIGNKHTAKLSSFNLSTRKDIRDGSADGEPEEVTDVILTYISIIVREYGFNDQQRPCLLIPMHLSPKQWQNYRNPSLFEQDLSILKTLNRSTIRGNCSLYWKICNSMNMCDLNCTTDTPGQIAVLFETEVELCVSGDVVPTSLNWLSWLWAYDNSVAIAMEEKRFMDKAKADKRTDFYRRYTATAVIVQN